jgi:hypothetical protein
VAQIRPGLSDSARCLLFLPTDNGQEQEYLVKEALSERSRTTVSGGVLS